MRFHLKNLVRRMLGRRVLADPRKVPLSAAVQAALALPSLGEPKTAIDPELDRFADAATRRPVEFSSRDLFSLNGRPLPAWREKDVGLEDDWVTAEDYYPLYHRFFLEAGGRWGRPRLLEIGVRTGYVGLCFAKALAEHASYVGVDPNLYLPDGLDRARASFALLARHYPGSRFRCMLGYSNNAGIQQRLGRLAPFHLIHVDGDHTLPGKLVDLDLCRSLLAPGGIVLVDDYTHIPSVIQEAVSRALHLRWYTRLGVLGTKRGMALLQL